MEVMPPLKFLITPLPSLVVDKENLVIGFGPPTLEMLPPSLAVRQGPSWPTKFVEYVIAYFTQNI